ITASNSGSTIIGSNFNKFNIGDKVEFNGVSGTYSIVSKANNTHMEIDRIPDETVSGAAVQKVYKAGDFIDLTTIGFDAGEERVVSASGTTLSFDLKESEID